MRVRVRVLVLVLLLLLVFVLLLLLVLVLVCACVSLRVRGTVCMCVLGACSWVRKLYQHRPQTVWAERHKLNSCKLCFFQIAHCVFSR